MKRLALLTAIALSTGIALWGLYGSAIAQELTGVIRGRVMDDVNGGPVADATVTLTWGKEDEQARESVTSSDGRYEFLDLPVDDELVFTLATEIDGAPVKNESVTLSTWTPEMVYDLTRADTTTDGALIHVGLSVVLPPTDGEGQVQVIEFLDIMNDGDSAYTEQDHDGNPIGLHVHIPDVAHAVTVDSQEIQTRVDETGLSIVDPIQPGRTLVTISYHFEAAQTADLSRSMHAAAREVRVMAGNPAYTVSSAGFTRGEPADIHGEQYATFQRGPVDAYTNIDIQVRRTGARASAGTSRSQPSSGGAEANSMVLLLLVGAISLMTGGAIGAWVMQSRRPSGGGMPASGGFDPGFIKSLKASDLMALKDAHLEMISHLDEQHESKELSGGAHRRVRDETKARLGAIMERLGGR
jgi:hypothetical protein